MKLTELGQAGFHGRILRESTVGCCEIPWSDAMRISGRMACETLVGWRAKPWSDVVRICKKTARRLHFMPVGSI